MTLEADAPRHDFSEAGSVVDGEPGGRAKNTRLTGHEVVELRRSVPGPTLYD